MAETSNRRTGSLITGVISLSAMLSVSHTACAQSYLPQGRLPEAHYWQDLPGELTVHPQGTVQSIFQRDPKLISVQQIRQLQAPNLLSSYVPKTDQQLAREHAHRETMSHRFGESSWHYGWCAGFDDFRIRLSYDF